MKHFKAAPSSVCRQSGRRRDWRLVLLLLWWSTWSYVGILLARAGQGSEAGWASRQSQTRKEPQKRKQPRSSACCVRAGAEDRGPGHACQRREVGAKQQPPKFACHKIWWLHQHAWLFVKFCRSGLLAWRSSAACCCCRGDVEQQWKTVEFSETFPEVLAISCMWPGLFPLTWAVASQLYVVLVFIFFPVWNLVALFCQRSLSTFRNFFSSDVV